LPENAQANRQAKFLSMTTRVPTMGEMWEIMFFANGIEISYCAR
jgi:hypothetical protein